MVTQFIDELELAVDELSKAKGLRAVVIASGIEKVFVSGADIREFLHGKKADIMAVSARGIALLDKLAGLPCPVICAINGVAFGGGLELALACDIRIMDKEAKVGLPEVGLGIAPGYGGTQRLPRLVGAGAAKRILFTGATVGAEEAYRIGLAEALAEPGQALADAKKLAARISEKAPRAVAMEKHLVDYGMAHTLAEGLAREIEKGSDLFDTEDKTEGMTAFLEKRKPVFRDQ
jgi:enoyl-CoA hydratase/carnithine racemase